MFFRMFICTFLILMSFSADHAHSCFAEVLFQEDETSAENDIDQQADRDEQETAEKLAGELLKTAAEEEPAVTAILQSFESDKARLTGLEHRLKSKESLARKILSDAHDMEVSPEEAAPLIRDVLRYTLCIDEDQYISIVDSVLKTLAKKHISVVKFKNYWGGDGYKGINTNLKTEAGFVFELQLHTPDSFEAKEEEHSNYEVARSETATENERRAAEALSKEIFSKVPVPGGAADYTWKIQQGK